MNTIRYARISVFILTMAFLGYMLFNLRSKKDAFQYYLIGVLAVNFVTTWGLSYYQDKILKEGGFQILGKGWKKNKSNKMHFMFLGLGLLFGFMSGDWLVFFFGVYGVTSYYVGFFDWQLAIKDEVVFPWLPQYGGMSIDLVASVREAKNDHIDIRFGNKLVRALIKDEKERELVFSWAPNEIPKMKGEDLLDN